MNLVWFVRYLTIGLNCNIAIAQACYIFGDRLKHEFDLLIVPIAYQLAEWGYPKQAEDPPQWANNPRMGRGVTCFIDADQGEVRASCYGNWEFNVFVSYPRNAYRRYEPDSGRRQFPNRNTFMEHFLQYFYNTPLGPEKPADKTVSLPPWTRTETGVWLCSL
jgi:hypothetical protein